VPNKQWFATARAQNSYRHTDVDEEGITVYHFNSAHRAGTRSLCLIAALFSAATAMPVAWAADRFVCAQGCVFVTVQSAVDSSASGDTIHIGKGTYFENVLIDDKSLTLVGAGEDYTAIDGRYRAPVFTLGNVSNLGGPAPKTVILIGMTITHGSGAFGGGIAVNNAILDLRISIIVSNQATEDGGGIYLGTPTVTHKITRSVITHDRAAFGGGIGVAGETSAILTDCTVARNTAGQRGGGIWVQAPSYVNITGTSVTDNASNQDGGGIFLEGGLPDGFTSLTNSTLANNTATRNGGGLIGGPASLKGVVIGRNSAGHDGGGIVGGGRRGVGLTDVFVIQNTAGDNGGGIFGQAPSIQTTLADNHPNNCAGGGEPGCP
jgi:predicted outer membrane repeat protein